MHQYVTRAVHVMQNRMPFPLLQDHENAEKSPVRNTDVAFKATRQRPEQTTDFQIPNRIGALSGLYDPEFIGGIRH
jgi:hypothetical protein